MHGSLASSPTRSTLAFEDRACPTFVELFVFELARGACDFPPWQAACIGATAVRGRTAPAMPGLLAQLHAPLPYAYQGQAFPVGAGVTFGCWSAWKPTEHYNPYAYMYCDGCVGSPLPASR